jgi:DNA-binding NarL/FixJ family response regulator
MTTEKTISDEEKLACSVEALPLDVRGSNLVKHLGFKTIRDLVNTDAKVLLATPNCGKKTLAGIVACLKLYGLKMQNSDGIIKDDVIEEKVASIRCYLEQIREERKTEEELKKKRDEEIQQKQIQVFHMHTNGTTYSSIGKDIGLSANTSKMYFRRFGRSLVREAKERSLSVAEILTERNIPLNAIEVMRNNGIE